MLQHPSHPFPSCWPSL